ncbi:MAG: phage head closure protein [Bacteroides sp.]|jgi:SPP1 family predicted phage head-tail adaptor|nr:phage head closure protein [Bacteroides sp.]
MRAGLLREIITLLEPTESKAPSGAIRKEYVETLTIKAEKRKITSVNTDIDAKEEFTGNTVVFRTRFYPSINDKMRIKWQDRMYKIILVDKQLDKTCILTCTKLNK